MSDPNHPAEPGRMPIADAASLFDSNVVQAYNPPPDPEPPSATGGPSGEYGIEAPASVVPAIRAGAKPAARPVAKPKPAATSHHFNPSDDDDEPVAKGSPSSRSDSTIRAERASRHDVDPESDSSDRAPSRSKKRSSDRAIGFDDEPEPSSADEVGEEVDPIWTRGAEWGPDLVRVGLVAVATLVLAYFAFGLSLSLAFLIVVLGGAACLLLSYPVAITIERPVRITPEQAVTDFFAAASHHLPHFKRMWLLLSPTARSVGRFREFSDFRSSWQKRMATWKEGHGGTLTPLTFRVTDFRGDKSVGHATSQVEYTVQVFVRGKEKEKPINSYRMMHGLVRGPDRMWYLNQGTLTTAR